MRRNHNQPVTPAEVDALIATIHMPKVAGQKNELGSAVNTPEVDKSLDAISKTMARNKISNLAVGKAIAEKDGGKAESHGKNVGRWLDRLHKCNASEARTLKDAVETIIANKSRSEYERKIEQANKIISDASSMDIAKARDNLSYLWETKLAFAAIAALGTLREAAELMPHGGKTAPPESSLEPQSD